MIRVFCKNTGTFKEFQEGTMLLEMIDEFDFEKPYPIIAALVNNVPFRDTCKLPWHNVI